MAHNRGFTLVEISIVLVIVGLLVGGILVGRNMIRSAEIRSVGTDVEKYKTAIFLFRDKFHALPGDMKNATQFWGAVAGGTGIGLDATCTAYFDATEAPKTETCNGNGDGRIQTPPTFWNEPWRVWQHLSNARLIEGAYTGQGSGPPGTGLNDDPVVGLSSPQSRVNDLTYALNYIGTITNAADYARFIGSYDNVMMIGKKTEVNDAVFTPAEAYELDSKIDDGIPGTGIVRSMKPNWRPNCATTENPADSIYQVNNQVIGCNLYYLLKNSGQ